MKVIIKMSHKMTRHQKSKESSFNATYHQCRRTKLSIALRKIHGKTRTKRRDGFEFCQLQNIELRVEKPRRKEIG